MESLGDSEKDPDDKLPAKQANKPVHPITTSKNRVQLPCSDGYSDTVQDDELADTKQVGCTPFFGVKHYIHNFYGLPDYDSTAKVWGQVEFVSSLIKHCEEIPQYLSCH